MKIQKVYVHIVSLAELKCILESQWSIWWRWLTRRLKDGGGSGEFREVV